jgi:PilZ domain
MFRTNPSLDLEGFGMSTSNDYFECLWDVLSVKRDRRAHTRSNSTGLTYVELGDANGGIAWNCSEGGMAITTAEILTCDNFPNIRFQLPTSNVWIEASARVAWINASKKGAGIKFIDLEDSDRQKIREWIASKDSATERIQKDSEDGEIDMEFSGSCGASLIKDRIAEVLSESDEAKFAGMFPSEKSLTNAPKSEWLAQDSSAAVMPFTFDTQFDPNPPNDPNPASGQLSVSQALNESPTRLSAEEHGFSASQISHAAAGFPLPTWQSRSTSAEPLLTELSAVPQNLPLLPVCGRQRRWKRHHLSPIDKVKSGFSVIASRTPFHLTRLRTSTLVIYQSLIRHSSLWRTKSWNVKVPFEWSGYVSSCLQWLRARTNVKQVRHAPQPVRPALPNDSSVRLLPSQALQRPNPQTPDLQRSVDFITSILHWLRQPMRTMRHRPNKRRRTSLS